MASNGLKMTSDVNVMFSKSFSCTEWSFNWSLWKIYYFWNIFMFVPQNGLLWPRWSDLTSYGLHNLESRIIFCWKIYLKNLLPSFYDFFEDSNQKWPLMGSNGLKMTSDANVMFSKSFWRTEWSFNWSQWKSYYFWPIFIFWPQNGL